jgi:hypothetical protein
MTNISYQKRKYAFVIQLAKVRLSASSKEIANPSSSEITFRRRHSARRHSALHTRRRAPSDRATVDEQEREGMSFVTSFRYTNECRATASMNTFS